MDAAAERKHHFFKIFHEEEQKRRLRIPVAFCQKLSTESPACERAILQGPNGASWVVQVNKTENGTFLEDGWETFVQDNCLKKYDFLVFRQDVGMQFLVKVFKGNGRPREECFAPVPSPVLAPEIHAPTEECYVPVPSPILAPESHGRKLQCFAPVPAPVLAPEIHESKEECSAPVPSPVLAPESFGPEEEYFSPIPSPILAPEGHGPNVERFAPVLSPIPEQESRGPKEECIIHVASPIPAQESRRLKQECLTPVASPIPAKESHGPKQECLTPVASPIPVQESHRPQQEYPTFVPSPLRRGRRRHGNTYENPIRKKREMLAFEREVKMKVLSFSSRFPFFWNSVKASYKKYMTIPIKFARENFIAKSTNPISREQSIYVLLQNQEGRTWELHVTSNAYQYIFSKGYSKFSTYNKLKVGDYVIFELIDKLPDAKYLMNFYIHRVPVIVPKEECFTPVASPIHAEESHGPREEFVISVPPQLRQGRKRHGISCERSTRKRRGTVIDGHTPRKQCFTPVASSLPAQENRGSKQECLTPVATPIPAQENHGPPEDIVISEPLGKGRERRASSYENPIRKKREMLALTREVKIKVMSFTSRFPFFWNCLKASYKRCMAIPVKFSREHFTAKATNPITGEESFGVLLQNEEARTWELGVTGTPHQHFFSKGFPKFGTDNNLKIGDYVIFELIDRLPDATFLMNFYIHRIPVFQADSGQE